MTTIELQQWRESFVERYLNKIDDMEISEELERAAKKIFSKRRTPRPCVIHSQEEMIAEVRKSVEDAREGRVTSISLLYIYAPKVCILYGIKKKERYTSQHPLLINTKQSTKNYCLNKTI